MRPAHQAREVSRVPPIRVNAGLASMRPAHQAREVRIGRSFSPAPLHCFNEARASSAGSKDFEHCREDWGDAASMRPAHQAREVRLPPAGGMVQ